MSAPIQPEPDDDWLTQDFRRRQASAGADLLRAPSDATAVRPLPAPKTFQDYVQLAKDLTRQQGRSFVEGLQELRHVPDEARQLTAGTVEAGGDFLKDAVWLASRLLPDRRQGTLRTMGRGEVRFAPPEADPVRATADRLIGGLEHATTNAGNWVASDTTATPDREMARLLGSFLAWEKAPAMLRATPRMARNAVESFKPMEPLMGPPLNVPLVPIHEYQMLQEQGRRIPQWLEDLLAQQEAEAFRQGDVRPPPMGGMFP